MKWYKLDMAVINNCGLCRNRQNIQPRAFLVSKIYFDLNHTYCRLLLTPSLYHLLKEVFIYTFFHVWYWPLLGILTDHGLIKCDDGGMMQWRNFNFNFRTWGGYVNLDGSIWKDDPRRKKP